MSAVGAGRDAEPGLPGRPPFGARLAAAMDERGPLCVGIDPHRELLGAWGLGDDAAGLRDFCLRAVEAVGGRVAAVKPQSAFFERHGAAGVPAPAQPPAAPRPAAPAGARDHRSGPAKGRGSQPAAAMFSRSCP